MYDKSRKILKDLKYICITPRRIVFENRRKEKIKVEKI